MGEPKTALYVDPSDCVCSACWHDITGKNTLACTWNPWKCASCGTDTHVTKLRNFAFTKNFVYE